MGTHRSTPGIIDKFLLPHTTWALLLLVPITFLGFYPSYYSTFKAPAIIHIHGSLMVLWLAIAIIQPWLIKTQKIKWHKSIGKLSFLLVPAILFTGYFVLRYGYLRVLGGDMVATPEYYPEDAGPEVKAADFVVIGSVYFSWLLSYYVLGILSRKRVFAHATFMLSATLTILGPAADRLIGHICDALGWEFNTVAENFTFGFVFIVFCALAIHQFRKKLPLWPAIMVLVIHLAGVFLYHTMPFHPVWNKLAAALFSSV